VGGKIERSWGQSEPTNRCKKNEKIKRIRMNKSQRKEKRRIHLIQRTIKQWKTKEKKKRKKKSEEKTQIKKKRGFRWRL